MGFASLSASTSATPIASVASVALASATASAPAVGPASALASVALARFRSGWCSCRATGSNHHIWRASRSNLPWLLLLRQLLALVCKLALPLRLRALPLRAQALHPVCAVFPRLHNTRPRETSPFCSTGCCRLALCLLLELSRSLLLGGLLLLPRLPLARHFSFALGALLWRLQALQRATGVELLAQGLQQPHQPDVNNHVASSTVTEPRTSFVCSLFDSSSLMSLAKLRPSIRA